MHNLSILLKNEIHNFLKIYGMHKYIFCYSLIGSLSLSLILPPNDLPKIGILITLIINSLVIVNFSFLLVKPDVEDGTMELLLVSESPYIIGLSKILALYIIIFITETVTIPILGIIFKLSCTNILMFMLTNLLLSFEITCISVLLGSMQAYFKVNYHYISVLAIPIIVPGLIISGMIVNNSKNILLLLSILIGMNFILFPVMLVFIGYLIDNIFCDE